MRRCSRLPGADAVAPTRLLLWGLAVLVLLLLPALLTVWWWRRQRPARGRAEADAVAVAEGFQFASASGMCTLGSPYFEVPGFLSEAECDALVAAATAQGMSVSQVGVEGPAVDTNVRMSTQAWLKPESVPAAAVLAQKVERLASDLLAANPECFRGRAPARSTGVLEDVQVVRYEPEGKYDPHHDSTECGDDLGVACAPGKQRVATVLIYLNDSRDGLEGGHTRFPELRADVRPEKGKALFFWVSDPDSAHVYRETLHGGDPVLAGQKWIATQWILAG